MRRLVLTTLSIAALAASALPASAQYPQGGSQRDRGQGGQGQQGQGQGSQQNNEWNQRRPDLPALRNAGPCPFVKVLYDAARLVEFEGGQQASAAVSYTGEINSLTATCEYRDDQPITVRVRMDMGFGRGPRATSSQRTYRYWVAVTQRNQAVLARETFEVPVTFPAGQDRVGIEETLGTITIPRAAMTVSGGNFEVLIGFEVTPEQAAFNREGRRFPINAGQTTTRAAATPAPAPESR